LCYQDLTGDPYLEFHEPAGGPPLLRPGAGGAGLQEVSLTCSSTASITPAPKPPSFAADDADGESTSLYYTARAPSLQWFIQLQSSSWPGFLIFSALEEERSVVKSPISTVYVRRGSAAETEGGGGTPPPPRTTARRPLLLLERQVALFSWKSHEEEQQVKSIA
jgi:hypothetical protein